jgi:exonuclease SbcD
MRLIHTADWHIGRMLHDKQRYDEFEAFLVWMADAIESLQADVLIVAGDIFDTATPSNRAQQLYYDFLKAAGQSRLRHIVIVGGNHDSPTFLDAPRELLKVFDIHVVGQATENLADEVLVLYDKEKQPELIVCAVPYLRDRDLRTAEAGESIEDKELKLVEGTRKHYREVTQLAVERRLALKADIPIVATGHLYTNSGKVGDGVRSLYVGTLAHVDAGVFPSDLDYVALGHLHVPQSVFGQERIRYSGSPIPMGFGEAGQEKSICVVDFQKGGTSFERHPIPVFRQLEQVRGDWPTIEARLSELSATGKAAWLDVTHEGAEVLGNFVERLEQLTKDTLLEVLSKKDNSRLLRNSPAPPPIDLKEQTPEQLFELCLSKSQVPIEQWPELKQCFAEVSQQHDEHDPRAT